ncbi:tRNA (adenine(37)-N6)-methyltransferase isoform X2 [Lethenteron reissneri]|nr:tRNA (adenine(37)-N6)-methyltransferase isoform X2 [Lethenteron reissneri]XP_061409421.1 tRNA (adenine(37)-N6)-methyltransferase isoform X2 [Lethenteron reissneri]XP_061409422.1 tRNA (adenine(37)-N6)-methyltransferase isoform X2 [Lethenteron reissneri]XP_061409423.1 tRNA (adenine(37)-N6)-methyltransferase isoform X2 [Lethenteron reissneri]
MTGHGEVQEQGPEMTSPAGKNDQHFVGRDSTAQLLQQMAVLRAELKNLRLQLDQAKRVHRKDVEGIKATLRQEVSPAVGNETEAQVAAPRRSPSPGVSSLETGNLMTRPVGYVESCFPTKNGTPRQPSVCAASRARVRLDRSVFSNAEHSLAGLQHFSHVWILFVFHKNGPSAAKAKVKPPRLNGLKVGVFSTRSPHRPNPIGLSLARLEKIEGGTLYLSGIDMIDGTPVLDIKPYIPEYDVPVKAVDGHTAATEDPEARDASPDGEHLRVSDCVDSDNYGNVHSCGSGEPVVTAEETGGCSKEPLARETLEARENSRASAADPATPASEQQSAVASWVREAPVKNLAVRFTPHAEQELQQLANAADKGRSALRHFGSAEEVRRAATAVLSADPRSAYRRRSCQDQLFYFHLDGLHLTCWFGDGFAEVLHARLARPEATATAAVPEGESKD